MEGGWRQFEMTDDAFFEPYLLPLTLIEPLNLALLFWLLKFKTLQSLEEVPILSRWVHGLLPLVNCCDGRSMVLELFRAIMGIEFDQNKRRKKNKTWIRLETDSLMRGVDFKIGCGFDTWVRHQHQIYRKCRPSSGQPTSLWKSGDGGLGSLKSKTLSISWERVREQFKMSINS